MSAAEPTLQPLQEDLLQMLQSLSLRQDILELEVAFWKSRGEREKNAWTYAEEAVAAEYGILPCQFMQPSKGKGRCKGDDQPIVRQAQFLLFAVLKHVVGLNLNDIRGNYGPYVASYVPFWGELYNLVHKPRHLAARDVRTWELYAPRFAGAYRRLRTAMLADGVWPDEFEDEYFTD